MTGFRIDVTDAPDPRQRAAVAQALLAFNDGFLGPPGGRPLAVLLRPGPGWAPVGGVWGRGAHGWLFIEMVFLPAALRGQGWGARLLAAAEAEAAARGLSGVWLDTFSPQARRFYERAGYAVFGTLDDYPPGHARWFLRKRLASAPAPSAATHPDTLDRAPDSGAGSARSGAARPARAPCEEPSA